MEQAQSNLPHSRNALAAAAKLHRGHPFLQALELNLEGEARKVMLAMAQANEPIEIYRAQGKLLAINVLIAAIKEPK